MTGKKVSRRKDIGRKREKESGTGKKFWGRETVRGI
jgi:hypothetical protein